MTAAALFLLLSAAYSFSVGLRASRGASISSDEPFYLITTQSLLQDGDLDLANQYESQSYRSFFDHPDGLWKQSAPLPDGRLLSPHNPGSVRCCWYPGFGLGGLMGAQVQLLVIAAGAMTMAFLLAERLTGRRRLSWAATLGVGLAATPFIYSTEIFPEFPAALALLGCLLAATAGRKLTWLDGVVVVACLSALCWMGVKYVPLVALVAGYFLWRGDRRGRAVFLVLGAVSAAGYLWFHLAVYQGLTPYNVNVVYAGLNSVELVAEHVSLWDRVYRLWGLLVDRRFGIGRWAPVFLAVVPGLALLAAGDGRHRLVLGLVGIQVLVAAFAAITMMGWWFPGRILMTVLPLAVVPHGDAAGPGRDGPAGLRRVAGSLRGRGHRRTGGGGAKRGDHDHRGPVRHGLPALPGGRVPVPPIHGVVAGNLAADGGVAGGTGGRNNGGGNLLERKARVPRAGAGLPGAFHERRGGPRL